MGCFRHINEIMQWSSANQDEKKQILKAIIKRKELNAKKHRGKYDF